MVEQNVEQVENLKKELEVAKSAAREAGQQILLAGNSNAVKKGYEFKADVDNIADEIIRKQIKEAFPGDSVITEEIGFPEKPSERLWIVDPLDGTTNFLNRLPFYSVLIALAVKEELVMGVSYIPGSDKLLWAVRGKGAWQDNKRLSVSEISDIERISVAIDAGYLPEREKILAEIIAKIGKKIGNIAQLNANGFTLSLIAEGKLPVLVHHSSKIWECAGLILVEEAGGKVTDHSGNKLKLNFKSGDSFAFVASNGAVHEPLLSLLKS